MSDFFTDRGMDAALQRARESLESSKDGDSRTLAERYHDELVVERRAAGRKTYGQGLEHTDPKWHWPTMAMEEAIDLAQYVTAENLRLREEIDQLNRHLQGRANSEILANGTGSTRKSEGER